MSNFPDDCGFNSMYDLPWEENEPTECPDCGSGMYISSLDKDKLVCENDQCCGTIDLSDTGMNDW